MIDSCATGYCCVLLVGLLQNIGWTAATRNSGWVWEWVVMLSLLVGHRHVLRKVGWGLGGVRVDLLLVLTFVLTFFLVIVLVIVHVFFLVLFFVPFLVFVLIFVFVLITILQMQAFGCVGVSRVMYHVSLKSASLLK